MVMYLQLIGIMYTTKRKDILIETIKKIVKDKEATQKEINKALKLWKILKNRV